MSFKMHDPIQNENYTVERMTDEILSEFRNYFPEYTYAEVNSEWVPEKLVMKYHEYFTNPLFIILENRRSGTTIYDYSSIDNDFSASGFNSDEVQTSDWVSGGTRNGGKEAYYQLNIDGSSWLYNNSITLPDDDFTFCACFTRAGTDSEFIFEKDNAFKVDINGDGYVRFVVYGSAGNDLVLSSKQINDTTQHRVVARWDKSEKQLYLDVDDVSDNTSGVQTNLSSTAGNARAFINSALSKPFTGKAHSLYLEGSLLSDSDIENLESHILPYGYEITDYYYDDQYGSGTTEEYGLSGYRTKHPFRRYIYGADYNYVSGSGLEITEVIS